MRSRPSACRCWSAPRASVSSTRSCPRRPTGGWAARSPRTCWRSATARRSCGCTTSPRPCRHCASSPRSGARGEGAGFSAMSEALLALGGNVGDARSTLERAVAVEGRLGRDRGRERRWGPRPVDIDLLAYDDMSLNEPDLVLPHPRLFERAFVLVPLAEI